MESPVRICIGAAIVINLLLICTSVNGGPLSHDASSTTVNDEKTTKYSRVNSTWTTKNKPKTPDVALNELHPKESTSEEHTEKNAKYKDRGRVKFQSHLKSTSESPLRRIKSSTEPVIYDVSSTTETVKSARIVNDVGKREKKSPQILTSTVSSISSDEMTEKDDMEEMNDFQLSEADEDNIFDRFTSSKFHDNFNLPGYNDDDNYKDKMFSQTKHEFSNFDNVLKHFSKDMFDSSENDHVHGDPYNSHSYFDFEADLTTPKNDYFDQKYADISSSIMNNLATVKTKAPEMNSTNPQDIIRENIGFEKLSNGSPNNKSMMIIKNTKEIRRLDNEQAGTDNTELSDIHGTSIYYEMSVLSTETYNINHSDDYDCDNDTLPVETTISTSLQEEDESLTAAQPAMVTASSIPVTVTAIPVLVLPNVIQNSLNTIIQQNSNIPISSQNYVSNTERPIKVSPRNRNYSKRLNLTGNKFSSNSVTAQTIPTMNSGWRPVTRKFYYTTPKIKPIWMAPRRNITKVKSSYPTTIYSEHFNIKDKYSTSPRPIVSQKTILTTLPSDIDPVLQSDVGGVEKFVQSQIITDNTIPTLSKRGSMKFTTSLPFTANNTANTGTTSISGNSNVVASSPLSLTDTLKESGSTDEVGSTASISSSLTESLNKMTSESNTPSRVSSINTVTPNLSVSLDQTSTSEKIESTDSIDSVNDSTNSDSDNTEGKDNLSQTGTISNSSTTSTEWTDETEAISQSSKYTSVTPLVKTDKVSKESSIVSTESVGTTSMENTDSTSQTRSEGVTSVGGMSINDLEIPPTMTAWALASLRTPPTMSIKVLNGSRSTQKTVDENELQKVSELLDQKETTTVSITSTTTPVAALSNVVSKNITEIDQNKLPWKPITTLDLNDEKEPVTKSERLPAESIISVQSSLKPENTTELTQTETQTVTMSTETISINEVRPSWIPAMVNETIEDADENEDEIQPVDVKKSTGFESITKLPSGVTTPIDENDTATEQSKVRTTTDYDITTIRFSYVPTEQVTETEVPIMNKTWHKIIPTRTNKPTTPITTYRPTYSTTTEISEETTTMIVDTTPQLEISSKTMDNATSQSNENIEQTTTEEITTNNPTTTYPTTTTNSTTTATPTTTNPTTESTTEYFETTTMITAASITQGTKPEEMPQIITTTEPPTQTKNESSSEENSDSNEVIQDTTKPPTTTTIITTTTITTTTEKEPERTVVPSTTEQTTPGYSETTVKPNDNIPFNRKEDMTTDIPEMTTKSINELEDLTSYADDMTTEASSRVYTNDVTSSGATIAIVVTTIGVIALILLVGLLLVVRRRGRRGVYAQRCTPVSLDAYSLDSVSVGHRKGNHRLCSKRSYGNPAYDDEVTSHPMQYSALANFALDVESMSAEFAEIPSVSVPPEAVPPGCEDKNRYSNVLPLPETRVPLTRLGNDPTTEYINANYVTGPGNIRNYYILSQAPLANTVADFWRMIWEQNSRLIVMLTEYMENGVEKCYEYLPPSEVSDNKRCFGDFQVILKKREQRDKYAISSLQLIHLGTRTWREVTHLWYFWPAKGVPDDYDSVIDFISEMRSYMKVSQAAKEYDEEGVEVIYGEDTKSSLDNLSKLRSEGRASGRGPHVYSPARAEEMMRSNNGTLRTQNFRNIKSTHDQDGVRPCVCVCASGAGRSAAAVALETCARALAAGAVDVPRVVRRLRAQRPHALANRHHYIFIYKVLSEYGNKLMGSGVDNI